MDDLDANTPPSSLGAGDRYRIRRELGRGMMGVVYEAEDAVLGRTVAVKTIDLAFEVGEEAREEFEQRFFIEARVAAKLSHPGIVVCHDVGKDPSSGKLFIVFEYLKGQTLAERLAVAPLDWREALAIVIRVARAIQHAHEHGVVHRDLKPANLMLLDSKTAAGSSASADTAVKIMDFGVARLESLPARLTRTGQSFGSPLYMSPEQALGQPSSARSDIFSLGSILCTLLLGRPCFDAPNIPSIVVRVIHDEPPAVSRLRCGLPEALDLVAARALAKRTEDRYPTAAALADDLEDVLAGRSPRHAGGAGVRGHAAPGFEHDPLLATLAAPVASTPDPVRADPTDPLASLLDEAPSSPASRPEPVPAPAPHPGAHTLPAAPVPAPARVFSKARLAVVAAVLVMGVVAAFLLRRGPLPSAPHASPAASGTPQAETTPTASPEAARVAMTTRDTPASVGATPSASARSSEAAPSTQRAPIVRHPAAAASRPVASAPVVADLPTPLLSESPVTRLRLEVEHPLENGHLNVWIDGVLVFETKLQATVSKRVVAIKVREGHLEKVLDVAPGRHEVRVEVSWENERRRETQLTDIAPGSTGLLEVRLARLTKALTLEWSRLARP